MGGVRRLEQSVVRFEGYTLELERGVLRAPGGGLVPLRPRAWGVLKHLAERAGSVVGKEELLQAVWPGLVVTDDSLAHAVLELRKALGEQASALLRTVPRRGYQLLLPEDSDGPMPSPTREDADRPSIAVLRFAGTAGIAEDALLAAGLAGDLIAELGRNADLRVVSRMASFADDLSALPLDERGRRLCSRFLVEGHVRRAGDVLRVDVQLLEAQGGRIVWSTRLEAPATALGELPGQLVGGLAAALHVKSREAERQAQARSPKSIDVYALTVRGLQLAVQFNPRDTLEGCALLEQAVALDPGYAPAWAWLAHVNFFVAAYRYTLAPREQLAATIERQIQRALALDPAQVVAYRALQGLRLMQGDFDAALAAAQTSVDLAPSNPDCLVRLAQTQARLGLVDQALATITDATLGISIGGWVAALHAEILWAAGRLHEALRRADEALVKTPGLDVALWVRVYVCHELGRDAEAREAAATLLARDPARSAHDIAAWFAPSPIRDRVLAATLAAGLPPT